MQFLQLEEEEKQINAQKGRIKWKNVSYTKTKGIWL